MELPGKLKTRRYSDASAVRESGIECLRILAMAMVLVLHADFAALGEPTASDFTAGAWNVILRCLLEQLALPAVNCFVLVSGWFSIRTSARGVCSLLFQVMYCALVALVVAACLPGGQIDWKTALLSFMPGYYHWFIRSYLGLMILAPVLNAWIRQSTVKQLAVITAAFYIFQTVYGWVIGGDGFKGGYSLLSFIGLYLLGALARSLEWQRRGWRLWLPVYLLCAVAATVWQVLYLRHGLGLPSKSMLYDSPLTVLSALSLTLLFASLRFRSSAVNLIAGSALAVYLLHFSPFLLQRFLHVCRHIYKVYSGPMVLLMTALFLLAVFTASIIADQPRSLLWNHLWPKKKK